MIILLEGPNGAGKTSVARILAEMTGGQMFQRNYEPLVPLVEYTGPIQDYVRGDFPTLIADRWHLSERVYGPILRNCNKITPIEWAAIEGLLIRLNAVGFIIDAELPTLVERLAQKGEDVEEAQLIQERLAFGRVESWSTLEWFWCNSTYHNAEQVAQAIYKRTTEVIASRLTL